MSCAYEVKARLARATDQDTTELFVFSEASVFMLKLPRLM